MITTRPKQLKKPLAEAWIKEQIRMRLDEVEVVYHQLPLTLERARKASTRQLWDPFLRTQASALRSQRLILSEIAEWWGIRTRPCFAGAVEDQLNEARFAMRARLSSPTLEDKINDVVKVLRIRVLLCLEESIALAIRIKEDDLAQRLHSLITGVRGRFEIEAKERGPRPPINA